MTGAQSQPKQELTGVRAVVVRICNILSLGILVLIVVVAASLLAVQALGFKPMAVLSGSMEPAYATGSVVFVDTNVGAESIVVGDVITYSLSGGDAVVTHRVIGIDDRKGLFTTKGDANENTDGPVPFNSFIGRTADFYLPFVGSLLLTMNTVRGIAFALFLLAFIVVLLMLPVILTPSAPAAKVGGSLAATGAASPIRAATTPALPPIPVVITRASPLAPATATGALPPIPVTITRATPSIPTTEKARGSHFRTRKRRAS
jgi:signal peptidase